MEIFDEQVMTKVNPDGTAKTESHIEGEKEFYEVCKQFLMAYKRFEDVDAHPDKYWNKAIRMKWWNDLEGVYQAGKRMHKMFVGESPDPASNRQYAQFREALIKGECLIPNA